MWGFESLGTRQTFNVKRFIMNGMFYTEGAPKSVKPVGGEPNGGTSTDPSAFMTPVAGNTDTGVSSQNVSADLSGTHNYTAPK